MSKFGIIFTAFNSADTIERCLSPWAEIKNENFVYSCSTVPFDKFAVDKVDNTAGIIKSKNIMDFHFVDSRAKSEIEARGICLEFLKTRNCDYVFLVDSDEFFTVEQISEIIKYVEKNDNFAWFKLSLKNYVFDEKTYLKEPFCPPRIFRLKFPPYELKDFREDNNLDYFHTVQKYEIPDLFLRNKQIPISVAWVKHLSWISNDRSRRKCEYQLKRWGKSSFQWNEQENKLEFNNFYYDGKLPEIKTE